MSLLMLRSATIGEANVEGNIVRLTELFNRGLFRKYLVQYPLTRNHARYCKLNDESHGLGMKRTPRCKTIARIRTVLGGVGLDYLTGAASHNRFDQNMPRI